MARIQINDFHTHGKNTNIDWHTPKKTSQLIAYIFLLQVINETVRLANIVPGIFRKVLKDVEIKGMFLVPGTKPMFQISLFFIPNLGQELIIKYFHYIQGILFQQVGLLWSVHRLFIWIRRNTMILSSLIHGDGR